MHNSNTNTTTADKHHFIVDMSCYATGLTSSLIQSMVSLCLLFTCTSNIKRHAYRWIIIQITLLVVIIVAFLVPYTFNEQGGYASADKFSHNVNSHFEQTATNWDFYKVKHSLTYAFFLHFASVLLGSVLSGVIVKCGSKSGYMAVR